MNKQDIDHLLDQEPADLLIDDLQALQRDLEKALEGLEDHDPETAPPEDLDQLKDALEEKQEAVRARIEDELWIVIDGEITEVDGAESGSETCPPMVENGHRDWYVDEDSARAGERARASYQEMAEDDPKELTCLLGEQTLVAWALGQYAGSGTSQVRSLEEWLDLWLDTPEEMWGGYDNTECEVEFCSEALVDELDITPTVAYRHN